MRFTIVLFLLVLFISSCAKKVYKNENQFKFGNEYFEYANSKGVFPLIDSLKNILPAIIDSTPIFDTFPAKSILRQELIKKRYFDSSLLKGLNNNQKLIAHNLNYSNKLAMDSFNFNIKMYFIGCLIFILALFLDSTFSLGEISVEIFAFAIVFSIVSILVSTILAYSNQYKMMELFSSLLIDLCNNGQLLEATRLIHFYKMFMSKKNLFEIINRSSFFDQLKNTKNINYFKLNTQINTNNKNNNIFFGKKIMGNIFVLFALTIALLFFFDSIFFLVF